KTAIIHSFASPRARFWRRSSVTAFEGTSDGPSLSSHRQGPDGGEQRIAREQPHEAALSAQPAAPPVLGREREPLGEPAPDQQRAADDRQEGHRRRARRASRQG